MAGPVLAWIGEGVLGVKVACLNGLKLIKTRGPSQLQFWFIALAIGIAAGFAALFFALGSIGYKAYFTEQRMPHGLRQRCLGLRGIRF